MKLEECLAGREPEAPLWCGADHDITPRRLRRWMGRARGVLAAQGVRGCLVCLEDPLELAAALAACDGMVERLVLAPAGATDELLLDFARRTGVETVVGCRAPPPLREVVLPGWEEDKESGVSQVAREPVATQWILATSGTTGVPKLVSYDLVSLGRRIKRDAARGAGLRWGLLYDPARFAGLQVMLQAAFGGSVLLMPPVRAPLGGRVAFLADRGCNALSATPSLWRTILMTGEIAGLRLEMVTLGGEIADGKILEALRARFPGARLTHVYASTEAGVGFSVTDGLPGFPGEWLEQPPPGVELRVDGGGYLYLRAGSGQDYVGREEALRDAEGWVNTGDLVGREGRRILFLGRANGMINVGGRKVFPEEVERCIREVPGVRDVAVRGRRNAFTGQVVEARVVAEGGAEGLRERIEAHCIAQLEDYKRPMVIQWVSALEISSAGKVVRR